MEEEKDLIKFPTCISGNLKVISSRRAIYEVIKVAIKLEYKYL